MTRSKYIDDLQANEITDIFSKFKADSDRPNVL